MAEEIRWGLYFVNYKFLAARISCVICYFTISFRCTWHSVRVIQLFVEHLVMKYEDLAVYARRLNLVS